MNSLAVMDAASAALKDAGWSTRAKELDVARDNTYELVDAAIYALRTRDDAGALSSTAEHNLQAALESGFDRMAGSVSEKNARLLDASTELLDALEMLLIIDDMTGADAIACKKQARAAIAKATRP